MTKYGRYELLHEIGQGTMGVVYLAHDPKIDRPVALKVIRQDHARKAYFLERFYKEAKAIGRISHPNIVTVYDIGEDHGEHFIAMEYIDGTPLNHLIQRGAPDFDSMLAVGIKLAEALDFAHQKGIIHRDIKPANIIMTDAGEPVITDFGIAHVEDPEAAQQTQAGEVLGTPRYMSPEQILGHAVDGRSDLYALGVILYELAGGRPLIQNENMSAIFHAVVNRPPEAVRITDSGVSASRSLLFQKVITRTLQKDPAARYPNGSQLAAALSACLEHGAVSSTAFPADPTAKARRKSSVKVLLAAALTVVIALLGWWAGWGDHLTQSIEMAAPGWFSKTPSPQTGLATVRIDSEPESAQVYIDGELQGVAPLQLTLPLGKYRLELRLPGHFNWERTLELTRADPAPIFAELNPLVF